MEAVNAKRKALFLPEIESTTTWAPKVFPVLSGPLLASSTPHPPSSSSRPFPARTRRCEGLGGISVKSVSLFPEVGQPPDPKPTVRSFGHWPHITRHCRQPIRRRVRRPSVERSSEASPPHAQPSRYCRDATPVALLRERYPGGSAAGTKSAQPYSRQ